MSLPTRIYTKMSMITRNRMIWNVSSMSEIYDRQYYGK